MIVGIPLGILFVHIIAIRFANVLTAGAVLSWGGIAFAAVGSILAALRGQPAARVERDARRPAGGDGAARQAARVAACRGSPPSPGCC